MVGGGGVVWLSGSEGLHERGKVITPSGVSWVSGITYGRGEGGCWGVVRWEFSGLVVGFAWDKWITWSSGAFRIARLTCKFQILYPPLLYDAQLAIGLAVAHVSMFRCVDVCRVFFLHLYIIHMHAAHICTHMTHMHTHMSVIDCRHRHVRLYTSSTHAGVFTLLQGYR